VSISINYVRIRFTSPFHVGKSGLADSYDYIPSYTIYGALEFLARIGVRSGIVRVSSAYPMVLLDGKPVLPVPMPAFLPSRIMRKLGGSVRPPDAIKELKGTKYIPLECLQRLDEIKVEEVNKSKVHLTCAGKIIECPRPKPVVVERNVLSRNLLNSDVYRVFGYMPTVDYVIFYEGEEDGVFEILGRIGLGGERTSGMGKFEVVERGSVSIPSRGEKAVLLGVGYVKNPRGDLIVDYLAWNCSHALIGPTPVLLDGSVLEPESLSFEDLEADGCVVRLSPMYIWL